MEISHASVETQMVAVGINGQAEEVTVSTDAEFMMTIAHGIYSNKALALVRELLCNARDGHAKAGKLDTPIHVTLTDNLLVVRDYGTGIPNNIFAQTYMTFGKSTKRQDKKATGGFGVGTKVPWAVCDVFSARNFIDHSMTAYSIVKSDPTMEGKPTCTPIMTIISFEPSGVEVSVPFPEKMKTDINTYLVLFANELGIPLILNGIPLKLMDEFNEQELRSQKFTRLPHHPKTVIQQTLFYIRQGDVIYPVEFQEEFSDAYNLLSVLNPDAHNAPILFMAEPDSIIPTLSRESLQYTDRTSESIRELMKHALKELADHVDEFAEKTRKFFPDYLAEHENFACEMWNNRHELGDRFNNFYNRHLYDKAMSSTFNTMLGHNMQRWLKAKTPYLETPLITGKAFREEMQKEIKDRFIKVIRQYPYLNADRMEEVWANRARIWSKPQNYESALIRNAYEEIMFWREEARTNSDVIEVYIPRKDDLRLLAHSNHSIANYFVEVLQLKGLDNQKEKAHIFNNEMLKETLYVSNTVVISHAPGTMIQRALEKYAESPTDLKNVFVPHGPGRLAGARCVRVKATMKPEDITRLKHQYEGWGYTVVLLLDPTKEELVKRTRLAEERAAIRAIPLPMLDELIRKNILSYPVSKWKLQTRHLKGLMANPEFKGEPLYCILPRSKNLPYGINTFEDFIRLSKFVGTDIKCVSTKSEIQRVIKEGRRNIEDALLDFAKWFFRRPDIREKLFYRGTFFVKRAKQNKYLTKYLFNRLPPELTEQEELIFSGLKELRSLFPDLRKYLDKRIAFYAYACTPEEHYMTIFNRYSDANFCDVHGALEKAYAERPSRKRALARSILKTILKKGPT